MNMKTPRSLYSLAAATALSVIASSSAFGAVVAGAKFEYDASAGGNTNTTWNNTGSQAGSNLAMTDATRGGGVSANTNITNAYSLNSPSANDGGAPGGNLSVNRSNGTTIETWIKRDVSAVAANTAEILVEIGGNNGYALLLTTNGVSALSTDGSPQVEATLDISSLNDSDFIHLTAVWDTTPDPNDQLVLYAKGSAGGAVSNSVFRTGSFPSSTGGGSATGVFNMAANGGLLDIGVDTVGHLGGNPSLSTTNIDYFRGDMSVLRIYDSALSAGQVQQNFDAVFIPEPSIFALFGLGGLALLFRRRK